MLTFCVFLYLDENILTFIVIKLFVSQIVESSSQILKSFTLDI